MEIIENFKNAINKFCQNFFMSDNTIILSSAGLKNVIARANAEDEFQFIFGNSKMKMNNIFADFISPIVAKMHVLDPTANIIDFTNKIDDITFTDDVLSLIQFLSKGYSININESQISQIQIISILLENEELFSIINEKFDSNINETNIDHYLSNLKFYHKISSTNNFMNYSNIINYIASHFYSIDESKMLSLPIEIVYSIILNSNLVVESEDSLFEFIIKLFNGERLQEQEDQGIDIVSFFEEIEFTELTENKFNEFIEIFSGSEMTQKLWQKVCKCMHPSSTFSDDFDNRYSIRKLEIEYDGIESHRFDGIINFLTQKSGGNVSDNGTVNVTSSSQNGQGEAKYAVDLHNTNSHFQSQSQQNAWIKYDFGKSFKLRPNKYSIRSRGDYDGYHPRNWVIEGSNTGGESESEWTILDRKDNDGSLLGIKKSCIYDIQLPQGSEEGYRYLRMRQIGPDSSGSYYLTLPALEYFGVLIKMNK